MLKNYYLRVIAIVLITSICCSYFGQILLFLIEHTRNFWKYLIYLLPFILIFTKYGNKYFATDSLAMKSFIGGVKGQDIKKSWFFPLLLTLNTLLAHSFGASVGREGVAVQLGGAIGNNLSREEYGLEKRSFLIRLGMICGFAALFQTPLAALFFILEITVSKESLKLINVYKIIIYVVASIFSARLSHYLGLEKFFVNIGFNISEINIFKVFIFSIFSIGIGISFVIVQKFIKKVVGNDERVRWILLAIFIIISVILDFRYSSLGTNLITFSFNNEIIFSYDFIIKLLLTALCTAIGFSGGEVTPLFAIGASLGVVLGGILGIEIIITAAIGYCLVFSTSTKTFITPIFLALEVFGFKLAILIVIPAILIYFINRKFTIYS